MTKTRMIKFLVILVAVSLGVFLFSLELEKMSANKMIIKDLSDQRRADLIDESRQLLKEYSYQLDIAQQTMRVQQEQLKEMREVITEQQEELARQQRQLKLDEGLRSRYEHIVNRWENQQLDIQDYLDSLISQEHLFDGGPFDDHNLTGNAKE